MRDEIFYPDSAENPTMSEVQKMFETWAIKQHLNLSRNWFVPYHQKPYTYEELFAKIKPTDYYSAAKTQGAWDAWQHFTRYL